ncbi:MAG: hypothetical protein CSA95_03700 [Bacteroidetes bacterium]|nr:MAG: hypothetical protein CSA95_03700 [Bacteroidota bacterium]PIE87835.1 MAG: hypothetical protein CSA04_05010 [Bacteroidota bacterium]
MEDKRFYRSIRHRVIGGICGGLGNYFMIDPVIIRILFIILTFAGGGGLLIYIILWILVPEELPHFTQNHRNYSTHKSTSFNTNTMNTENAPYEEMESTPSGNNTPKKSPEKNNGTLIAGIMLIVLGCMFLMDRFIPHISFGDLWPLILVVIGAILIYENYRDKSSRK